MTKNQRDNNRRIDRILRSFRKYRLTTRSFVCKFNEATGNFVYILLAARRNSGLRGGRLRNQRDWYLLNLFPEQRAILEQLPKQDI